jgi:hypothetical protein
MKLKPTEIRNIATMMESNGGYATIKMPAKINKIPNNIKYLLYFILWLL